MYRCFPEVYNIEDYVIYFNDQDNERSIIKEDDDLQAAYQLMNMMRGSILIFFIDNKRSTKLRGLDSVAAAEMKAKNKRKLHELLENQIIIRQCYVF